MGIPHYLQGDAVLISGDYSVCLTVTTLFVGSLLVLNLSTVISLLFVTAMLSLIGALLTFFETLASLPGFILPS